MKQMKKMAECGMKAAKHMMKEEKPMKKMAKKKKAAHKK